MTVETIAVLSVPTRVSFAEMRALGAQIVMIDDPYGNTLDCFITKTSDLHWPSYQRGLADERSRHAKESANATV